jgi:hypothetical protein
MSKSRADHFRTELTELLGKRPESRINVFQKGKACAEGVIVDVSDLGRLRFIFSEEFEFEVSYETVFTLAEFIKANFTKGM